jgi:hypothetical protein
MKRYNPSAADYCIRHFDELPGEPDPPPSSRSWLWAFAVFAVPVVLIALVRMRGE